MLQIRMILTWQLLCGSKGRQKTCYCSTQHTAHSKHWIFGTYYQLEITSITGVL